MYKVALIMKTAKINSHQTHFFIKIRSVKFLLKFLFADIRNHQQKKRQFFFNHYGVMLKSNKLLKIILVKKAIYLYFIHIQKS